MSTAATALRRAGLLRRIAAALWVCAAVPGAAQAQSEFSLNLCGELANHYGPYDYRTEKGKLVIVDQAHFTPVVEALIRGSTGDLNADLDYTLRASPNHHRALVSVMRLAARTTNPQPPRFKWPLACYFDRAVRFAPDDVVARLIYAQFLGQSKKAEDAVRQAEVAIKLAPENALTQYNAGLVLFEVGEYDKALAQAHVAQKMGFTRTELADSLKRVNRWREPQ